MRHRGKALFFGGFVLFFFLLLSACTSRGKSPTLGSSAEAIVENVWHQLDGGPNGRNRSGHAVAYDSVRGKVVLFGGTSDGSQPLQDTWEFDGATWSQRFPPISPPARIRHAMAFDAARGKTVLFGGSTGPGSGYLADTWEWDGSTWTQRQPIRHPSMRSSHALTYDVAHGKVVLFGGETSSVLGDTWTWDGNLWTQLHPSVQPSARSWHSFSYDSDRSVGVLFGGYNGATALSDTWEWNGTTWIAKSPNGQPSNTSGAVAVYDTVHHVTWLLGGATGNARGWEVWQYDGTSWSLSAPGGSIPSYRLSFGAAFDTSRGKSVVVGGEGKGDTWEWDGTTWIQVHAMATGSSVLASDTDRGVVVLFNGGETWEWNGQAWSKKAPAASPPSALALTYDSARQVSVLLTNFTYVPATGYMQQTWEWDGSNWTNTSANLFGGPTNGSLVFDEVRHKAVLVSAGSYVWEYDGTSWSSIYAPSGPIPPAQYYGQRPPLVFDGNTGEVMTVDNGGATWFWDGSSWTKVPTNIYLTDFGNMVWSPTLAHVVLIAPSASWEWTGTEWFARNTTTMPPPRPLLAYDSVGQNVLAFHDSPETGGSTWAYTARDSGPDVITLVSPSGDITNGTTAFVWNAHDDAEKYQLSVDDTSGTGVIDQVYTKTQANCPMGTGACSVAPSTAVAIGTAKFWVRMFSDARGWGPWSDAKGFVVTGKPSVLSPSEGETVSTRPTFTWTAVTGADLYELWVDDSTVQAVIDRFLLKEDVGCPDISTNCSYTPTQWLAQGGGRVWVRTWSYLHGWADWPAMRTFNIVGLTLLAPYGSGNLTTPTYVWMPAPSAEKYELWVDDSLQDMRIDTLYTSADLGCGDGVSDCSITPTTVLAEGTARFKVRGWSSAQGYQDWVGPMLFGVGGAPAKPTLISPMGATTVNPSFSWTATVGAEWYLLQVDDASMTGKIVQWYTRDGVGCAGGGTCVAEPGIPLASGSGSWSILPWSSATGYGMSSDAAAFVVQ